MKLQLYALGAIALLIVGVIFITPLPKPSSLDRKNDNDITYARQQIELSMEALRAAQMEAQRQAEVAREEAILAAQQQLIEAGVLPADATSRRSHPSLAPQPIGSFTLAGALVALVLTAGLYPILSATSRNYPEGRHHFAHAFSALACIATALHLAINVFSLTVGRPVLSPAIQLFAAGVELPGLLLAIATLVRAPGLRPVLPDVPVTAALVPPIPADL
jgi:hypothetical protein